MVKLPKDKLYIEVSESTVRRALQKHECHYIGPKICQKYLEREVKKDKIGVEDILINIGITYFLMKLQSILIILQVINWWRKMKIILNTNIKRRGQKPNFWKPFKQMEK